MLTFTELPPHRTRRTWEAQENDFTYRLECHEHAEADFWTLTVAFEGRPLATTEISAADAKAMLHKRTEDGDAKQDYGRWYNWYLSCIVDGRLDTVTFPNPAADPTSPRQALARAADLRSQGYHAYAVEIREILPQEDDDAELPRV